MIAKTIIFRAVSFLSTLLLARLWFGDWHISGFQIFLLFYCSAIYYGFEKAWDKFKPAPSRPESRPEEKMP